MTYEPSQKAVPDVGATFVPGGADDFYLPIKTPEVVSPAPQRVMPEVPEHIQENLAQLELEASGPRAGSAQRTAAEPQRQSQNGALHDAGTHPPRLSSLISAAPPQARSMQNPHGYPSVAGASEEPSFSPFPKLVNPPPNVPPSDEEKEAILENARTPVLNSNDPEMQLAWAQDALAYVDVAAGQQQRLAESRPGRPVTPQIEHSLRVDAVNIVVFLADQHHPKGEFMRGMWLEMGKFGFRLDKKEAFRCYSRAADKGYARAEYRIGMLYEQSNDPVKALMHYKRGAEAGDSPSNYRLGMMTLLGQHGQVQDLGKGVELVRIAAATADENAPQGAYVFGMLLAAELPQIHVPENVLPYDERLARENIEKAAYLGFAKAQAKMGSAYELCTLSCEFNPALSLHYNALAARQGEAEAEMALSKWFLCGYEDVFQKNEELAYKYAERATQAALPTALFALGYFHEIGVCVPVNLDKAREWYEKAAVAGNEDAKERLKCISMSRALSKKDHENIAISRIRSQYGSKRGKRPERLKKAGQGGAPALPTIVDTPPNAPYPLDDRPAYGNGPGQRADSASPYPVDGNGMGQGLPRPGAGSPYNDPGLAPSSRPPRASSAFGQRSDLAERPATTVSAYGQAYPSGNASYPDPSGMPRPNSAVGYGGPAPQRVSPYLHGAKAGAQDYRQQGEPDRGRYGHPDPSHPPSMAHHANTAPRLDVGFAAPFDDRAGRLITASPVAAPRPLSDRQRFGDRPVGSGGRTASGPTPSAPRPQQLTETIVPGAPPKHLSQTPSPGPPGRRPDGHPPRPGQGGPKSSASLPAGGPGGRQPSKGPKTFEEMGITQAKQEGDCIIM